MKSFYERNKAAEDGSYAYNFWKGVKTATRANFDTLSGGAYADGTYLLPLNSRLRYNEARQKESTFRELATVIEAYDTEFNFFAVDGKEPISWVPEGKVIPVADCANIFTKSSVRRHKLATILRLHEDILRESKFDVEDYLIKRLAKDFSRAEDAAFISGTGENMPIGILHDEGGAEVGIRTNALTYDNVLRLFFTVDPEYRDHGTWLMNDRTAATLRTLKDESGAYLWNSANDTILGRPVCINNAMPDAEVGSKPIAFGDFSYYWIIDRDPVSLRLLQELYTMYQQCGYYAIEFLDARLLRSEAIKVLQITNAE